VTLFPDRSYQTRIPCKARLFVTKPQQSCEAMVKIYRDVSGYSSPRASAAENGCAARVAATFAVPGVSQ
jgi:hypothetical protein